MERLVRFLGRKGRQIRNLVQAFKEELFIDKPFTVKTKAKDVSPKSVILHEKTANTPRSFSFYDCAGVIEFHSVDEILAEFEPLILRLIELLPLEGDEADSIIRPFIKRFTAYAMELPASECYHHYEEGGLVRHSLETALLTLQYALAVSLDLELTPRERRESLRQFLLLAFAGGLLHDAGKVLSDLTVTIEAKGASEGNGASEGKGAKQGRNVRQNKEESSCVVESSNIEERSYKGSKQDKGKGLQKPSLGRDNAFKDDNAILFEGSSLDDKEDWRDDVWGDDVLEDDVEAGNPPCDFGDEHTEGRIVWNPVSSTLAAFLRRNKAERYGFHYRAGRGKSHETLAQIMADRIIPESFMALILKDTAGVCELFSALTGTSKGRLYNLIKKADIGSVLADLGCRRFGSSLPGRLPGALERFILIIQDRLRRYPELINTPEGMLFIVGQEVYLTLNTHVYLELLRPLVRAGLAPSFRDKIAFYEALVNRGIGACRNSEVKLVVSSFMVAHGGNLYLKHGCLIVKPEYFLGDAMRPAPLPLIHPEVYRAFTILYGAEKLRLPDHNTIPAGVLVTISPNKHDSIEDTCNEPTKTCPSACSKDSQTGFSSKPSKKAGFEYNNAALDGPNNLAHDDAKHSANATTEDTDNKKSDVAVVDIQDEASTNLEDDDEALGGITLAACLKLLAKEGIKLESPFAVNEEGKTKTLPEQYAKTEELQEQELEQTAKSQVALPINPQAKPKTEPKTRVETKLETAPKNEEVEGIINQFFLMEADKTSVSQDSSQYSSKAETLGITGIAEEDVDIRDAGEKETVRKEAGETDDIRSVTLGSTEAKIASAIEGANVSENIFSKPSAEDGLNSLESLINYAIRKSSDEISNEAARDAAREAIKEASWDAAEGNRVNEDERATVEGKEAQSLMSISMFEDLAYERTTKNILGSKRPLAKEFNLEPNVKKAYIEALGCASSKDSSRYSQGRLKSQGWLGKLAQLAQFTSSFGRKDEFHSEVEFVIFNEIKTDFLKRSQDCAHGRDLARLQDDALALSSSVSIEATDADGYAAPEADADNNKTIANVLSLAEVGTIEMAITNAPSSIPCKRIFCVMGSFVNAQAWNQSLNNFCGESSITAYRWSVSLYGINLGKTSYNYADVSITNGACVALIKAIENGDFTAFEQRLNMASIGLEANTTCNVILGVNGNLMEKKELLAQDNDDLSSENDISLKNEINNENAQSKENVQSKEETWGRKEKGNNKDNNEKDSNKGNKDTKKIKDLHGANIIKDVNDTNDTKARRKSSIGFMSSKSSKEASNSGKKGFQGLTASRKNDVKRTGHKKGGLRYSFSNMFQRLDIFGNEAGDNFSVANRGEQGKQITSHGLNGLPEDFFNIGGNIGGIKVLKTSREKESRKALFSEKPRRRSKVSISPGGVFALKPLSADKKGSANVLAQVPCADGDEYLEPKMVEGKEVSALSVGSATYPYESYAESIENLEDASWTLENNTLEDESPDEGEAPKKITRRRKSKSQSKSSSDSTSTKDTSSSKVSRTSRTTKTAKAATTKAKIKPSQGSKDDFSNVNQAEFCNEERQKELNAVEHASINNSISSGNREPSLNFVQTELKTKNASTSKAKSRSNSKPKHKSRTSKEAKDDSQAVTVNSDTQSSMESGISRTVSHRGAKGDSILDHDTYAIIAKILAMVEQEKAPVKRGRGRPRKNPVSMTPLPLKESLSKRDERSILTDDVSGKVIDDVSRTVPNQIKRGRGRPRKNAI